MLELRNITKTFGNVTANNDVSIKVEKGTIHAIVGENGAGKSTIMRIAYGFYNADSGEILVDGNVVSIKSPHDAIALGIGMVHQHFMLVDTMTAAENIVLGAETGSAVNLDMDKANRDILALSNELRLGVNPKAYIEDMSVGQQQRVELLKALYRNAELLILDEPTAVLSPQEVEEFFGILRRMKEQGKTIIIITHKLEEVLAISDEVTVMRDGKSVGNVKTSETSAKDLAHMIVGRDVLLRVDKSDAKPTDVVLEVKNLTASGKHGPAIKDVSFTVRAGEIVGIAGIEGNGQTELIESLAGLEDPSSGGLFFQSDPMVSWKYPTARSLRNLLLIPLILNLLGISISLLAATRQSAFILGTRIIPTIILISLIIALKKRKKWACYAVMVLATLGLIGAAGGAISSILSSQFDILGFGWLILTIIFEIYAIIFSIRALREFALNEKTEIDAVSARKRKELGIAHIPEDRQKRGLLLHSDLAENSILGVHYRPPVAAATGFMNNSAIQKRVGEIIENFDVRPRNPALPAKSLSGGNQQKLIVGREFELNPKLLLVSQPTRGVDIGAIEFIHRKLIELRDAGSAVLLVSAELEEVTALADRLLVFKEGKVVGEVDPKVTSVEDIGLMMTGGD